MVAYGSAFSRTSTEEGDLSELVRRGARGRPPPLLRVAVRARPLPAVSSCRLIGGRAEPRGLANRRGPAQRFAAAPDCPPAPRAGGSACGRSAHLLLCSLRLVPSPPSPSLGWNIVFRGTLIILVHVPAAASRIQ